MSKLTFQLSISPKYVMMKNYFPILILWGKHFNPHDLTSEKKHWDKLSEVLGWVDGFVAGGKMVAGTEQMTLADLAIMATYATLKECELTDLSKYTNIEEW